MADVSCATDTGFQPVAEQHQFIDLGDDAVHARREVGEELQELGHVRIKRG